MFKVHGIITKYTFLTALRDWLFMAIVGLLLLVIVVSGFLGNTALVEQSHLAIVIAAAGARTISTFGIMIFVCFHVQRALEHKEIELILSRPIGRVQFILAYYLGFALLALAVTMIVAIFMMALQIVQYTFIQPPALMLWLGTLYLEMAVLGAFSMFVALFTNSAIFASMICAAFYFLARVIGFFLILANTQTGVKSAFFSNVTDWVIRIISMLLPRFDMMTQTEWLLYGIKDYEHLMWGIFGAIVYIPLVLSMIALDMRRKQF